MMNRLKRFAVLSPLTITLTLMVAFLILYGLDVPFLRFMELKALDLRILSRGAVPAGGEVVIATIDEKSLSELGRWPWPRTVMARLVDMLKGYGAKAVGFDIVFAEADENASLQMIGDISADVRRKGIRDPRLSRLLDERKKAADTDAILADSIARAKNVTLGYFFHTSQRDIGHMTGEEISGQAERIATGRYPAVEAASSIDDSPLVHAFAAAANLSSLSDAAENSGYFNAFPDSDGSIRWSPLVIRFGDHYYLSLAMALLHQYLDWPPMALKLSEFGATGIQLERTTIPTNESGWLLVNYLGPPKTFPVHSIADILGNRLDPSHFRGKIVLVGATATGIYDLRVTPFSAVFPGVEIHATVIDNILHRQFLVHADWTRFIDVLSIMLCGLIMGLVVPRLKAMQGILFALLLTAAFVAGNTLLFIHARVWLNVVYPVLGMLSIYLAISVYRYVTEEQEKKKIRGAFQYYLTASVITEMLKDPSKLKLGGAKKDLSVLFSDIRGFTTISERLTPEELVRLLNEYLTAMTDIVFQYDGLLDKYMGDAIMAVYGAPLDQPDHALRACRTAIDMMAELRKLQRRWAEEGRPEIDIGVGINSGEMVVGNMGSQMRFDYTVMGDSVNLGSRLEGINKEYGTHIVISEFTHRVVKDALSCRELDAVRVKGKKLPVKIYELLGEKGDPSLDDAFVRPFEEGLEKYRQCRWEEAIADFERALLARPGDPPSALYIQRCRDYKESPPDMPWDGVYTMTKK